VAIIPGFTWKGVLPCQSDMALAAVVATQTDRCVPGLKGADMSDIARANTVVKLKGCVEYTALQHIHWQFALSVFTATQSPHCMLYSLSCLACALLRRIQCRAHALPTNAVYLQCQSYSSLHDVEYRIAHYITCNMQQRWRTLNRVSVQSFAPAPGKWAADDRTCFSIIVNFLHATKH
jgi:hypothetical protein